MQVTSVAPCPPHRDATSSSTPSRHSSRRRSSSLRIPLPLLGHHKYSVERILALEEYTRTKSFAHVLRVVFVTPLVPLLIVIAYEMPPLQPVDAGWRANWVFLVERLGLGIFIVCAAGLTILHHIVPELDRVLTLRRGAAISAFCATLYVLFAVVLAETWGFPIPFTTSICNLCAGVSYVSAIFVTTRSVTRVNRAVAWRCVYFCLFACSVPFMTIVYPAYIAVFLTVGERFPVYQPFVTLLVPLLKLLLRQLIGRLISDWEDLIPIMSIFSVEFFSALYQVICVQSGSSPLTTAAIMGIDVVHAVWGQWKIHTRTRTLARLLRETDARAQALLPSVRALCDNPSTLRASALQPEQAEKLRAIHLRSSLRHCGLSPEGERRLDGLYDSGVFPHAQRSDASVRPTRPIVRTHSRSRWRLRRARVTAATSSSRTLQISVEGSTKAVSLAPMLRPRNEAEQAIVLVEAAAMLYTSEFLLLGEYIECIIPWLYGVNLASLWVSPNAAFYPHTRAMDTPRALGATLANICALFVLEAASFVALSVVLRRRMHFSPLHQLSYVLEHQSSVIQANMTAFLVLSLLFNLDHVGADYSFQFAWLQRR